MSQKFYGRIVNTSNLSQARSERGSVREPGWPPVRGDRFERRIRGRRGGADPEPGRGVPGRRDQGIAPEVVRRPAGRRADRGARLRRGDLLAFHDPQRAGGSPLERA